MPLQTYASRGNYGRRHLHIPSEVTVIAPDYTLGRRQSLSLPLILPATHYWPLIIQKIGLPNWHAHGGELLHTHRRIHPGEIIFLPRAAEAERCFCVLFFGWALSVNFPIPQNPMETKLSLAAHHGPYGCIGKQLALLELQTVITLLILKFNFALLRVTMGLSY